MNANVPNCPSLTWNPDYFNYEDNSTLCAQFSLTPSDSSLCSPRYSITIADDSIPHEVERDFFSQLYGGDTPGWSVPDDDTWSSISFLDAGNIPEEYYSYLENWYRSQVSAFNMALAGATPELHNTLKPPFSLQQVTTASASSIPSSSPLTTSPTSSFSSSVFIPVSALQHLRASLPAGLPHLGAAGMLCLCIFSFPQYSLERSSKILALKGHHSWRVQMRWGWLSWLD